MLQSCLEHVLPFANNAEIIVVDNGSHDGSAAFVHQHYPHIRLLALTKNRGFSGGVNAGLAVARGDYLVLLNNDALAEPDFLTHLVAPLAHDHTLGASAGVLTFAHQPQIVASAGIRFHRDGVALDDFMLQPVTALPAHEIAVWGASGGAVAYRRAALQDIGVFDEGYFAYLEDVDLAWRLRLRGWQTMLAPLARARHIYSATGGEGSPFKTWLLARNRWRVILRCVPTPLLQRDLPFVLAYDLLACSQAAMRGNWTTITGRMAIQRQWREVLAQRQHIQSSRTTSLDDLDRWIQPARSPLQTWRDVKRLHAIMHLAKPASAR